MFDRCEIGIKDKYDVPIKEGDMLIVNNGHIDEDDGIGIVQYDTFTAMFNIVLWDLTTDFDHIYGCQCEVVGSIYDKEEG